MAIKVLVVEDDRNIAELLEMYLKKEGYEPVLAYDGGKGLELYHTEKPDLVKRFVQATMEGWVSYMKDPAPGNALIQQDNPEMTDEQIAFGIDKMKEYGLVFGGDAATGGVGVMTDKRWQALRDFMVKAELIPADFDIKKVYTLAFLPAEPQLLQ